MPLDLAVLEQIGSKLYPALSDHSDCFGRVVHSLCAAPFPHSSNCIILSSIPVVGEISTLVTRIDLITLHLLHLSRASVVELLNFVK